MDTITRAWYGLCAENALLKKSEQAYEDFFCTIMEAIYSDSFQLVKASGSDGDGKADGYLVPDKCVFQSYAPSSGFQKQKLLKKIKEDFLGAVNKWGARIEKWVLIHNSNEGLPKYALDLIDELKDEYANVGITAWGPNILREKILTLPVYKLVDIFGLAPSQKDVRDLTHEPVKSLLRAMGSNKAGGTSVIAPVSVKKLQWNKLSPDVESLLNAGRRKENLVNDLLSRWPDPEYGEGLAGTFHMRYKYLKSQGLGADKIFSELKFFAGGDSGDVSEQVSSLAILSYFFERCDIFENAPEETDA